AHALHQPRARTAVREPGRRRDRGSRQHERRVRELRAHHTPLAPAQRSRHSGRDTMPLSRGDFPLTMAERLRTEFIVAGVLLCFGVLVLPFAIYFVGLQVVGEYRPDASPMDLPGDLWSALGNGEI